MGYNSGRVPLFTIFAIVATELIGFGLVIPVMPQIASRFATSGLQLGLLLAAYSFAQIFGAPILGTLSDRYGRKPVLVVSQIGTVLSYGVLILANNFPVFLMARLLDGFTGGNIATARAYIADITPIKDRAKGMAFIGIAFGVGFLFGPAIGGIVYAKYSIHVAFAIAGLMSALALMLTVVFLKEPETRRSSRRWVWTSIGTVFADRSVRMVIGLQFVFTTVFSGFETTFALFTADYLGFGLNHNSLIFIYIGVLAMIVQGSIARRSIHRLVLAVGTGLMLTVIGCGALVLSNSIWFLLAALAVLAVGVGLTNTVLPTLLSTVTKPESEGEVLGIYEGIGSLSRVIGPMYAALLYTHIHKFMYGIGAIVLGCATLAFIGYRIAHRRTPAS